ncbi:hypothetical protein CASFOL_024833 [Castilleja foliolosa]|uniref:Uncharacterized protein n=1 Tax=Castilleja foliolosa TaxID=1961234 RepID=A0ABD3CRX6_9LAMI
MDKKNNVQSISVTMVLILLFAIQASADNSTFKICYVGCFVECMFDPGESVCILDCIGKCKKRTAGINYCKHGCAVDQCAPLITEDFKHEDVEKVVSCVNKCNESQNGALSP